MHRALALRPLFLALGFSTLLLAACGEKTEKTSGASDGRPIQVFPVTEADWPRLVSVPGTVSAVDTAALASRAGGWVARVEVDAGAHVEQGALLAEVGAPDARGKVAEAQSRLTTAEATLNDATSNERRYGAAFRAHVASAQQYEAAQRSYVAAKAEAAAAATALTVAKNNLNYAEIRAPFTGMVAEKKVWPGDFAAPGATLFVIAGDHPEIRAHVGPTVYSVLKAGDQAEVVIDGKTLPAVVTRVVAAADPKTRTHLLELHLQGTATAAYGAYAELRLTLGRFPVLTVPATAVVRRAGLLGVFVVDKAHRAHFRLVRTGESRGGRIAIVAGLAAGEMVVAVPAADLMNNSPVKPQIAAPGPAAAETTRG
jgi:multidrug efflux system membrane fusion protein